MTDNTTHQYACGDTTCIGYLTGPTQSDSLHPAVIVAHDWTGCNDFAKAAADKMAAQGYVGFALDMYGEGKLGADNDEKAALMTPFMEDRALLHKRLDSALETVRDLPNVDVDRIAIIGFCFGGLCAYDLARTGVSIRGAVGFHGLLMPADNIPPSNPITAKILALHGYDDPMAKPDAVVDFCDEMSAAGADWQMHMFGNTMHAFTNPIANDKSFGTVYDELAANRAWLMAEHFLREVLS